MLSGPSGVGKTTLIKALMRRADADRNGQITLSTSCTTRPARQGEEHGKHYYFVSPAEFAQMVDKGEFLEHAEIYGQRYGTPRAVVERELAQGRHVLLEIDWQGAQQVRQSGITQRSVFILPPEDDALEKRLDARGLDAPGAVAERIRQSGAEMEHAQEASHCIVNDDFDRAANELYHWCFPDA